MTCQSNSFTFFLYKVDGNTCHDASVIMFPTDSPFNNGQGNDYLFVGNMVYTVSVLPAFSLRVFVCIMFLFLCPLAYRCVHIFASAQCLCTHQHCAASLEPV